MSIASEITRISGNIAAAYTALDEKGATLPETQNSANLADTIDSISVGGAGTIGDDFDRAAFNAKVTELTSVLSLTSSSDTSANVINRAINAGFTRRYVKNYPPASNEQLLWYVLQFAKNTETINISTRASTDPWLYWAADGIVVYDSEGVAEDTTTRTSERDVCTFDFTNTDNRTIVVGIRPVNTGEPLYPLLGLLSPSGSGYNSEPVPELRACHIFLNNDCRYSSSSLGSLWTNYWYIVGGGLRILTMDSSLPENITKVTASNFNKSDPRSYACSLDDTSFLQAVCDSTLFNPTLGVFEKPANLNLSSSDTLRSITQFGGGTSPLISKFPIKLDFSSYTSAIDFGANYARKPSGGWWNTTPVTVYIILPSANVNMLMVGTDNSSANFGPNLTLASWQYLAAQAPTVSSNTLKVGANNYKKLSNTSLTAYNNVLTTLTGKGWTVSAS